MDFFYFGLTNRQLFGSYHPPSLTNDRRCGVLICNPTGHEYLRSHWALRHLALQLSRRGYHVLRFDYSGTGDSAGETDTGNVLHWIEDVETAFDELKNIAGIKKMHILGLRFGAFIALKTCSKLKKLSTLILWDPILSGSHYIEYLYSLHHDMCNDTDYSPSGRNAQYNGNVANILGFPLSNNNISIIKENDNTDLYYTRDYSIEIVLSSENVLSPTEFEQTQNSALKKCSLNIIADEGGWDSFSDLAKIFYPNRIIQFISKEIL